MQTAQQPSSVLREHKSSAINPQPFTAIATSLTSANHRAADLAYYDTAELRVPTAAEFRLYTASDIHTSPAVEYRIRAAADFCFPIGLITNTQTQRSPEKRFLVIQWIKHIEFKVI